MSFDTDDVQCSKQVSVKAWWKFDTRPFVDGLRDS